MATRKPFQIAVLSDQHIDRQHAPDSWDLAKAAFRAVVDERVDHVVLAGDTFDCATAMYADSGAVQKYLKRLGLWSRDRLSIVTGNHDVFHTPHHSVGMARARELACIVAGNAAENLEDFVSWVWGVVDDADWLAAATRAPYAKDLGHVQLLVADTTADDTFDSGNGFWRPEVDNALRGLDNPRGRRRILAVHHAPKRGQLASVKRLLNKGEFPLGFPASEFARLRAFVDDCDVDALVCGHLHSLEGKHTRWKLGRACRVFLNGRTGGMWTEPTIGVLSVPRSGAVTWREMGF
jgi:hypothetical protein